MSQKLYNFSFEDLIKYYLDDYLQIFYMTKEGKSNLKEIISLYGIEQSMVKKLRI